jgi:phospholipid/cholesterol/gamma-HCH transport system substrate-binding protein
VFAVVSLAILIGMLVSVLGSTVFADRDEYEVHYDISVSGLEIGAPVKYNGVRVGRVDRIWIDSKKVSQTNVALSLQEGTPIKKNTRAVLNVQGITGLKFIELVGGTSEAKTLSSGSVIQAGTSVVDKLTGKAESLSIKAELLINQLLEVTGGDNRALFTEMLKNASHLMASLDRAIGENESEINELIRNSAHVSARTVTAIDELRALAKETRTMVADLGKRLKVVLDKKRVTAVLKEAHGVMTDIRQRLGGQEVGKIIKSLQKLVDRSDALVERLDVLIVRSREDVRAGLRFLSQASENFRDFTRLIREDPSRLLRSRERRERELP